MTQTFAESIRPLKDLGYIVEDMGEIYGEEYEGQFRWMNPITGDFQDDDTSDSLKEAWEDCLQNHSI